MTRNNNIPNNINKKKKENPGGNKVGIESSHPNKKWKWRNELHNWKRKHPNSYDWNWNLYDLWWIF
jgi:hypothetical protein